MFDVVEFTISRLNNLAVDMKLICTPSLKLTPRIGCLQGNTGSDIQNDISRFQLFEVMAVEEVEEVEQVVEVVLMSAAPTKSTFGHYQARINYIHYGLLEQPQQIVLLVIYLFLWPATGSEICSTDVEWSSGAMWLWGMSVLCEIWFAFSWILDQLRKLNPVNRSTDLAALHEKFKQASPANPLGKSDLQGIDVFVSTADPEKEPPLVTANTILSILAINYPIEKLCWYISDEVGDLLTFEAMVEDVNFAQFWVPFC
ncbi:hypothetical protein Syun_003490 [Stephania yunnanensis]|uniref:Uncharacterized protein n=1 Tax=Stephania yunnanensis TaxID=152371 RepID=A0AAP0L2R9_9MAGN